MSVTATEPGSSADSRLKRRVEIGLAGCVWAALVIGSAVLALTFPVYTSAASQALGVSQSAGLPPTDVLAISAQVRSFVADRDSDPLPSTWRGQPAFDASAVSHLVDVRTVLAGARFATGIAALLLAAYTAFCVMRGRIDRLRAGMRAGALLCGLLVVVAGVAAVSDFSSLFAGFHSLFFKSGTWTFPVDSLLIRLFPERFWIASGAAWALLVIVGASALLLASRMSRSTQARFFASRTANNV